MAERRMFAKFCKEKRCNKNNNLPCSVADDCFLFKWDIERQQGKVTKVEKIGGKTDGRKEVRTQD